MWLAKPEKKLKGHEIRLDALNESKYTITSGNFKLCEGLKLLVTSNSVSVISQTLASVACYVSKQVDFSKLTVVELNAPSLTKCMSDYLVTIFWKYQQIKIHI